MILDRWNYKTKRYEFYEIPDTWNIGTYRESLTDSVDCAICGETITFGESYTSLAIHTKLAGIGYCVCSKCHGEEIKLRFSFLPTDERDDFDGDL